MRIRSSVTSIITLSLSANLMGQGTIRVGQNVQVSAANSHRAHWEVRMAAKPDDEQQLLACSMVHSAKDNSVHTIVYTSSDGGKNWIATLESDQTKFIGDPDCVFGLDGMAYFSTLRLRYESAEPDETLVYRSPNGGTNWEKPIVLPFIDREYMTIDRTSGEYRGRIYLHGNALDQMVDGNAKVIFTLLRSMNGGLTFRLPVKLIPDANLESRGNGNGEVLSDGTYVAVFQEEPNLKEAPQARHETPVGSLKIVRTDTGGDSFTNADVVSPWYDCRGALAAGLPMIAADHSQSPFKDRLYTVWGDKRSGHCDVRFSYSADKGKTWSASIIVNDDSDPSSPDRFADHNMPAVVVNKNGVVGISWYDRRENPDDVGWWVRFTASLDGGETFLPSVKVSEAPHKAATTLPISIFGWGGGARRPSSAGPTIHTRIQYDQGEGAGGDTGGIVADSRGVFHALWVDNRTGVLQLWTAPVSVDARAMRNGDEELTNLADVTRDVELDYTNTSSDPKSGIVSFDAKIINTSKARIVAPLKLRVIGLSAQSGVVRIMNADNRRGGTGAVWDFSDSLSGGVLEPKQNTRVKRLEFHLAGSQPFRRGTEGYVSRELIRIESKALAQQAAEPAH